MNYTLFANAARKAQQRYGNGFRLIGSHAQRAAVAEEIYGLIAQQDRLHAAETVRRLVGEGWEWLNTNYPIGE